MTRAAVLLVLPLAACARPRAMTGYATTKAASTARSSLGKPLDSLVPARGFLFVSGGFVSTPRRCVVDFDKRTLVVEDGGKPGASAFGPMSRRTERALTEAEAADLLAKANAVWASTERLFNERPIADFDVRLVLGDGDDVRDVDSYGPPVGPVDALYTAAMKPAAPAR